MDLKSIQEKLNNMFTGSERQLVFWYDDNAGFAEKIDDIKLDNAKLYKLKKDNYFYTKYFFECVDKVNDYLVYAPFPQPADKDNHLADTIYYSQLFYADIISLVCVDLHIPNQYKEHLERYPKFWDAMERQDKFMALGIESYNDEIIDIALLAVLANVKVPNFEEIVKTLITSGSLSENKALTAFEKMGLLPTFWQLAAKYFGYSEEKPTLERFAITLLLTYTAHSFKGDFPKVWQPFISPRKNDVEVFVKNLMSNVFCREQYDELAAHVAARIKAEDNLKKVPVECYIDCDTFEIFDCRIIAHCTELLVTNHAALPVQFSEKFEERATQKHYSNQYRNDYHAIDRAMQLLKLIEQFEVESSNGSGNMVKDYVDKWSAIDMCYRQFYTAYDAIVANENFHNLRDMVENLYTNGYLAKLSVLWAERLNAIGDYGKLDGVKQKEFYQQFVDPSIQKRATAVIISDAFRYEAAKELHTEFEGKEHFDSELSYMISSLPSYTSLGMAALLPHKEIAFQDNFDVLVDQKPCASSEQRQNILQSYHDDSVVSTYTDLMAMNQSQLRELLNGKKVIYIYHNQVDARGDNPSTENEVFTACDEARAEITKLIAKLTDNKSIYSYFITADHGFIYKRDKLDESDKVRLPKLKDTYINKRFLLSREQTDTEGALCFSLNYLGANNDDVYVTVPRGVDVFKAPGGGQNYVHGGASLQEIIIPVIKLKTASGRKSDKTVEVILTSLSRKITNLITYLDFIQNENVSDVLHPVQLQIYFENESGDKISGDVFITANKKNETPEKRQFRERFAFKNARYTKNEKYFLVMKDTNTDDEVARHEFIIDIAFADDFGFGV